MLDTDRLAYKLLGMQLLIETIALTVFQTVRESKAEPVLCELMTYYERDEARHVGLGMQYLPSLMGRMGKAEISALITFQVRLLAWALLELKLIEKDFVTLGIDPRRVVERGRRKQLAALQEALKSIGVDLNEDRNYAAATVKAVTEVMFPTDATRSSKVKRLGAAWSAFWGKEEQLSAKEFEVHHAHAIKTMHGEARPS